MPRVAVVALLSVLAPLQPAAAATVQARAEASARILDGANVRVMIPLAMPTISATGAVGAHFASSAPWIGLGGGEMPGKGGLTVRRENEGRGALTAPGSFTVVRAQGAQAVMLKTNTSASLGVIGDGVLLGGALVGGAAASIDVGSGFWLASADAPWSGAEARMLVVLVQYN